MSTETMRAATSAGDGGPEVLSIERRPRPLAGPDDVLVRVAYAGLNRADLLERAGRYGRLPTTGAGASERPIPGIEYAGVVAARGANVSRFAPGARVCGIAPAGAHAEYLALPATTVAAVPDGMTLPHAAAVPEAFLTSFDALFTRGDFGLGRSVLVHAVGSSAGLAAVSLARFAGGFVVGTSRTREKLERARAFGLHAGFLPDATLVERVRAATEGRGVDLVLDFVGGPETDRNVALLATGGRIVQIGTLAGTRTSLDLGALMGRRATIVGTVLRTRGLDEKIGLAALLERRLLPSFSAGDLRVEIDAVYPLERIAEAHTYMEDSRNFGKVVIEVDAGLA